MRVRSLMQTYRTLLASVEYARLPEGLDYDEVHTVVVVLLIVGTTTVLAVHGTTTTNCVFNSSS